MQVRATQDLVLSDKIFPLIMNRGRWAKIDTVMRCAELTNTSLPVIKNK
jgi:hypothetical protein